jgi:hypothetical protein
MKHNEISEIAEEAEKEVMKIRTYLNITKMIMRKLILMRILELKIKI